MKGIFEVIYSFLDKKSPSTTVYFFAEGDVYKTNIINKTLNKMGFEGDKIQGFLRKRYDYHKDLVSRIDEREIDGLYAYFVYTDDDEMMVRVGAIPRNRKIDDIIGGQNEIF